MKATRQRHILHPLIALFLAAVYIQFQIEPYDAEYEENNPPPPQTRAFSKPSLTWETFDKQNAPKAFVVNPWLRIDVVGLVPEEDTPENPHFAPVHPVRDKSPPSFRS